MAYSNQGNSSRFDRKWGHGNRIKTCVEEFL